MIVVVVAAAIVIVVAVVVVIVVMIVVMIVIVVVARLAAAGPSAAVFVSGFADLDGRLAGVCGRCGGLRNHERRQDHGGGHEQADGKCASGSPTTASRRHDFNPPSQILEHRTRKGPGAMHPAPFGYSVESGGVAGRPSLRRSFSAIAVSSSWDSEDRSNARAESRRSP